MEQDKDKLNPEINDQFAVFKEDENQISANTEEIIKETEERVRDQKTNKSRIINCAFFVISILVLIISLLLSKDDSGVQNISVLFNSDFKLIVLLFIVLTFVAIMLIDSFRTYLLLYKATRIHRPFLSYKSTAICRYYDCITPFTFGGQPFQIYYLSSRGVKGGIASSVPLAKYMFNQISFSLISVIMLIIGYSTYGDQSALVISFSIASLIISIVFLMLTIFISVSKKIAPTIIMFFLRFLYKIKLIKNYKLSFVKTMRNLVEYRKSIKYYLGHFGVAITTFISSIVMVLLKGIIPYLIYIMLTPQPEVSFAVIFCKFIICELATMYIPLPGGTGMAEISFTALFASLFNDGLLFWALLIYRIATYYVYIAQGVVIILYDIIWGDKRNKVFMQTKLIDLQIKAQLKKK